MLLEDTEAKFLIFGHHLENMGKGGDIHTVTPYFYTPGNLETLHKGSATKIFFEKLLSSCPF
jgi:hypothetical protein